MEKRWKIKSRGDQKIIDELSEQLGIEKSLSNLLVQRGIFTFEEAKNFFRPSLEHLHDPFLMKDMDKAIDRLEKALHTNEKILVYGDYDVDGTTAVALLFTFLKNHTSLVEYYIPDRYAEGYGISFKGIDYAAANKFSLIVALDCGIKSIDKINYANERGIDFIICDHHRPGDELPKALAVLDPKRNDCNYPFKELSGCGIGFKLVQAFAIKNNISIEKILPLLDLVAVSTAADIVPIVGENRVLMYYGLQQINKLPRNGIKAILDLSNVKRELTVSDLVFILGPRINAAGRVETGRKAVDLLTSENYDVAIQNANNINKTNLDRRVLDTDITQHALSIIEENSSFRSKKTTVLFHSEWHKGVIGIVASRLIEKYYKPTIILTESNGMATGSARSVKDFDVYEAIEECSHLLEQFGGHKYAAGLTMKLENVNAFVQKFEEVVSSTIEEHMLVPEIEIDEELELEEITPKFFRVLKQFAPFGPENMAPVFVTKNVTDKGFAKIVGNNHLKLNIVSPSQDPALAFSAIAFGQASKLDEVKNNNVFDICYSIEENIWNGTVTLQLNIKDIKVKNS